VSEQLHHHLLDEDVYGTGDVRPVWIMRGPPSLSIQLNAEEPLMISRITTSPTPRANPVKFRSTRQTPPLRRRLLCAGRGARAGPLDPSLCARGLARRRLVDHEPHQGPRGRLDDRCPSHRLRCGSGVSTAILVERQRGQHHHRSDLQGGERRLGGRTGSASLALHHAPAHARCARQQARSGIRAR
jgi:hypothetical protein